MIDDTEVQNQFRQISDAVRHKKITRQEAQARLYKLAGELELDQWQILEDLRTRAPENERELARKVADLLEERLRYGSGNA